MQKKSCTSTCIELVPTDKKEENKDHKHSQDHTLIQSHSNVDNKDQSHQIST